MSKDQKNTKYDSESSTAEENKRKRQEMGGEEGNFNKSRKTYRTPPKYMGQCTKQLQINNDSDSDTEESKRKGQEDEEGKKTNKNKKFSKNSPKEDNMTDMQELKGMMKILMQDVSEIRDGQQNYMKEINELKEENKKLTERLALVEKKFEALERTERKNNIVIKGANIREDMAKAGVQEFLKTQLGVTVSIISARVIKSKYTNPMVIAKVGDWEQKMQIMKNKAKLKGKPIYIDDDLAPNDRKMQAEIRNIAKNERRQGKTVKVGFGKINLNGEFWIWDETAGRIVQSKN